MLSASACSLKLFFFIRAQAVVGAEIMKSRSAAGRLSFGTGTLRAHRIDSLINCSTMPTYDFNLAWRISGALDSETLLIYHLLKNIFILSLATEMVFRFPRDGLLSNRKVLGILVSALIDFLKSA